MKRRSTHRREPGVHHHFILFFAKKIVKRMHFFLCSTCTAASETWMRNKGEGVLHQRFTYTPGRFICKCIFFSTRFTTSGSSPSYAPRFTTCIIDARATVGFDNLRSIAASANGVAVEQVHECNNDMHLRLPTVCASKKNETVCICDARGVALVPSTLRLGEVG